MRFLDVLCERIGRAVAWLTGLMALLTFVVVVLRYGFQTGAIALQEAVMYLHGIVFLLGIPYALKHDAHVRVDLLYSRWRRRRRHWVNLLGHLFFLLPFAVLVIVSSLPYVAASWRVLEGSTEVGGIPAVFLLKTLIPVSAGLLLLQGLVEIHRCLQALRGAPGVIRDGSDDHG